MEFDMTKIYSLLNADLLENKKGLKGYFADSLGELKEIIAKRNRDRYGELTGTTSEKSSYRFIRDDKAYFALFYLVKEPEERKFRSYKDTDEMIEDFKKRFNVEVPAYGMPFIWVKNAAGAKKLITTFGDDFVRIGGTSHTMEALLESYTYLDGSFCGMKE